MVMEEKTPEAEATEVTNEVAQAKTPTVEELQTQLTKMTADWEAAKTEAKSHQKYGEKTRAELEKQRKLDAEVETLKANQQIQTEMIAALLDKEEELGEEAPAPKKRRSEEFLAKTKQVPRENPNQGEFVALVNEAEGLVKAAGLDMEKSPELKTAFRLFRNGIRDGFFIGDAQDGLEEVKRVIETKKEPLKTEVKKELSETEEEEIARKYAIKMGWLTSETNMPSSATTSVEKAMADYVEGKISAKEAESKGVKFS